MYQGSDDIVLSGILVRFNKDSASGGPYQTEGIVILPHDFKSLTIEDLKSMECVRIKALNGCIYWRNQGEFETP